MKQQFDSAGNPILPPTDIDRRSWPEDFAHENGNYWGNCCNCGKQFIGHKRRLICKLCDATANQDKIRRDLAVLAEANPQTHLGDVAWRAAEYIRQLENEVSDLRRKCGTPPKNNERTANVWQGVLP